MTVKLSSGPSNALRLWASKHPRQGLVLGEDNTPECRSYWMSALSAGAVSVADLDLTPAKFMQYAVTEWALVKDFDISSQESVAMLRRLADKEHPYSLHSLWFSVGERLGLDGVSLGNKVAHWMLNGGLDLFAADPKPVLKRTTKKQVEVKKTYFRIDTDGFVDFLFDLLPACPTTEMQQAYLLAVSLLANKLGQNKQEKNKLLTRHRVDVAASNWWAGLPVDRQSLLQHWAVSNAVQAPPAIQEDWVKANPTDPAVTSAYLATMNAWWPITNEHRIDEAMKQYLVLTKLEKHLSLFEDSGCISAWMPFLESWFTPSVCGHLWSRTLSSNSLPSVFDYVQRFEAKDALSVPLSDGSTLCARLLNGRADVLSGARLPDSLEWLNKGPESVWESALWKQLLNEKVSNIERLSMMLKGVSLGFPLASEQKQAIWLRYAGAKGGPSKVLHTLLKKHYSIEPDLSAAEAVDVWLADWLPGHGKLLSTMLIAGEALGLDENIADLRNYLAQALTGHTYNEVAVPEDFTFES